MFQTTDVYINFSGSYAVLPGSCGQMRIKRREGGVNKRTKDKQQL